MKGIIPFTAAEAHALAFADLNSHCRRHRNDDELRLKAYVVSLGASRETQRSISDWANATFGAVGSNASVAARANKEMAELLTALISDDAHPKAIEEAADVMIVLMRLAERCGMDLLGEVDRKMGVNRKREWNLDGNGNGQHVKDGAR